jgi:MarR family transcriptional regulator, organic hydroperoxide resistance regulator
MPRKRGSDPKRRGGAPSPPGDEGTTDVNDRDSTESFGEVLDFMRLIWAVSHGLHATSKRMDRTLGVTGPQRLVIRILGRRPGVSAGELAEILHLHPSTLTGVLRRVQERGLIARASEPHDRRRARLHLTDKGRRFDVLMKGTVEAAVAEAIQGMPRRKILASEETLGVVALALGVPRGPEKHRRRRRA